MSRYAGRCSSVAYVLTLSLPLLLTAPSSGATPLQFVPTNSLVNGPPYPTAALTTDIVADVSGTTLVLDRMSSSVKILNPIGAVDWFVADSFSFGVEQEMKESGEKGGTEDINIGVGELQECTISKSMDRASSKLAQFAINGNSLGAVEIYFVEVAGGDTMRMRFVSELTTPQPAVFTNVSLVPNPDGHTFDLNFSLLYNAPYDPQLPILNEVVTGELLAIPEPSGALLLLWASAGLCMPIRLIRKR